MNSEVVNGLSEKSMKCSKSIFIAGIIVVCLSRLILIESLRIIAIPVAGHDDGLFVRLAVSILNGEWLGPYNNMTLAKGPFYPIFLAANFMLGLPLKFSEHLLYLVSGIVFLYALSGFIKNRCLLLFIFIIYAFNPVTTSESSLRVIREGIYPSLTVLVLAGMIGLTSSAEKSMKQIVMWALLAGLSLSAFWLTREEGAWIIPSVFILLVFNGWRGHNRFKGHFWRPRFFIILLLPIVIGVLGVTLVAAINKSHYDIFATNELKHDSFSSAYAAFLRVKHPEGEPIAMPPEWKSLISVPRSVTDALSRVSPAFRDIYFNDVRGLWVNANCMHTTGPCDEINGGYFLWALRDAVQNAGHYSDGKRAANYYRKLANEINAACDKRLLDCGPKRSFLVPPLRREHLEGIPSAFIQEIQLLTTFIATHTALYPSPPGSPEGIQLFQYITRHILSPPLMHEKHVRVMGWVFRPGDDPVDVKVISDSQDVTVERQKGRDVAKHFNDPSALNSRFVINAKYYNACKLLFSIREQPLAEAMLNEKPLSFKIHDPKTRFAIDKSLDIDPDPLAQLSGLTFSKIDILNKIADIYSKYFRYFGVISLICYFYTLFLLMRHRITSLFFINSALLLAMVVRLLLISVIHVTSFPAYGVIYISCIYPLMLIFACTSIIDAAMYFPKRNQGTVSPAVLAE